MLQYFANPIQVAVALRIQEEWDNRFCSGSGIIQVKEKFLNEVNFENEYVTLTCYLSTAQSFPAKERG